MLSRRLFLGGLLAGTAAPAIVRASSLMPIWVPKPPPWGQTIVGMQLVMDAQRQWSEQLARKFHDSTVFGQNVDRDYPWIGVDHGRPGGDSTAITQLRVLSGEIGQVDRFTIISTSLLPRRKPWR